MTFFSKSLFATRTVSEKPKTSHKISVDGNIDTIYDAASLLVEVVELRASFAS